MVSRRNFFAITIVMGIIFFLFQFSNIAKERWNHYEENSYVMNKKNLPTDRTVYQAGQNGKTAESVVYIGKDSKSSCAEVVSDWALYAKKESLIYTNFSGLDQAVSTGKTELPELVLIESSDINWNDTKELEKMEHYAENGVTLIFSQMPDLKLIKEKKAIRNLL